MTYLGVPVAKARPSVQKRLKEAKAMEKKQQKAVRAAARAALKEENSAEVIPEGVDKDLMGMVAGPQVVPWHEEDDGL